jgi:hypothetical protein
MNLYNQFFISSNHFLKNIPLSKEDQGLRMFGIETGDAFIGNTPIEGHQTVATYKQFLKGMESIIQTHNLPIDLDPFKKASEWANKIEQVFSLVGLYSLANEMKTAVESMKVGDSLWLPLGWSNREDGGHAMSLCIRRISKSRYEVTTLNTGDGISHHPAIIIDGKRKTQTFLTISGVAANRLCRQEFFETILEMRCAYLWELNTNYSSEFWYETVLPYLGGYKVKGLDYRKFPAMFQLPQRSGTCTMEAIFALLHYQLKHEILLYKKSKIIYRQWALNYSLNEFAQAPNYSYHKLISLVAQQQARSIQHGFQKWRLDESLYKNLTAELMTFEISLNKIKQKALQNEKGFFSNPIDITAIPYQVDQEVDDCNLASYQDDEDQPKTKITQNNFYLRPVRSSKVILERENSPDSTLTKDEILSWTVIGFRQDLLPSLNDPFWGKIPEKELSKWIEALADHVTLPKIPSEKHRLSLNYTVHYFYILALIDQLARRHPDLKKQLKDYDLFCHSDLINFAFSKYSIIIQPVYQKRLLEILEHYNLDSFDPSTATNNEVLFLDNNVAINRKKGSLDVNSKEIPKNPQLKFLSQFLNPTSKLTRVEQITNFLSHKLSNEDRLPPIWQRIFQYIYFTEIPYPNLSKKSSTYKLKIASISPNFIPIVSGLNQKKIWRNQNELTKPLSSPEQFGINLTSHDRIGRAISSLNHSDNVAMQKGEELLFVGCLLHQQLKNEPRTAIQLMQMVHVGLKQHQMEGSFWDSNTLKRHLEYAALALKLKEQIEYASQQAIDTYAPFEAELAGLIIDFADYLRTKVYATCNPKQKKWVISVLKEFHDENIVAHLKKDIKNTAKDLLLATFHSVYSKNTKSVLLELSWTEILNEVMAHILKMKLGVDLENSTWTENLAQRYSCQEYEIQFDTGKIIFSGTAVAVEIPSDILCKLIQLNLIEKNNYQNRLISPTCHKITTLTRSYQLTIGQNSFDLVTEFDGLQYQLVTFSYTEIPWINLEKDHVWLCIDKNTRPHYLVKNNHGKQLFMHIEEEEEEEESVQNDFLSNSYKKIAFISDDLERSRLLVTPSNSPFHAFVPDSQVKFWKNRDSNQMIDTIEFDEHLKFEIKNEQIYSSNFPDFYLVNPQEWLQKLGVLHLIVLQNNNGQQKVLLRTGKMNVMDSEIKESFDPFIYPQSDTQWGYRAYDVVQSADEKTRLHSYSPADMLELSYQLFLKKRYTQAAKYFQRAHFVKGMDDDSLEKLKEIIKKEDPHPNAVIFQLRAALALARNDVFYGQQKWESLSDTIKDSLYLTYLKQRNNTRVLPLTTEEEIEIIRLIQIPKKIADNPSLKPPPKKMHPEIIQRLKVLLGKQSSLHVEVHAQSRKFSFENLKNTLSCINQIFTFDFKRYQKGNYSTKITHPKITGPIYLKELADFDNLFLIARYGSKKEKDALWHKLQLNDTKEEDPFYVSLIKCALTFPRLFSLVTLTKKYQNLNYSFYYKWKNRLAYVARIPAYALLLVSTILNELPRRKLTYQGVNLPPDLEAALTNYPSSQNEFAQTLDLPLCKEVFMGCSIGTEEILKRLNHSSNAEKSRLKRLGRITRNISWNEAVNLFLCGEKDLYRRKNPDLTDQEIEAVDFSIGSFLAQSTKMEAAERHYTHELSPEIVRTFLVFEYQNGILLRKNQVDSLVKFVNTELSEQIVSKQGTGSGKSKIQYPLLQYMIQHFQPISKIQYPLLPLRRQHVQPVLNIWPKALFPRNRDDMQQLVNHSFIQKSETFPFNRQIPLDPPTIGAVNRTLSNAINDRQQINTVGENVQSSELTFLEVLYNMAHGIMEVDQELFATLQKTQQLLKTMSHHVDECHIVQDPKKELNYSIGIPESEPNEYIHLITKILRLLITPEINQELHLLENMQHLASKSSFEMIATKITDEMEKEFKVPKEYSSSFREYVLNLDVSASDWIINHPQKQKIALLRGINCRLLKECFYKKRAGVNYGFSNLDKHISVDKENHSPINENDDKKPGIAIPYFGNNSPVFSSEYELTFETLIKTFHIYLHQKLNQKDSWELVSQMQKMVLNESKRLNKRLEETPTYLRFEAIRSKNVNTLFNIKPQSSDLSILSQNNEFILDYIVLFVTPSIQKYPKKLKSTAQNLRSQFTGMISSSATPKESKIYAPNATYYADSQESDLKVEERIRKVCADQATLHIVPTQTSREIFTSLINIIRQRRLEGVDLRMLNDTGPLLAGLSNLEVAEVLLNQLQDPAIQGIVFFDDNENQMVLERQGNGLVPIERTQLKPDRLFTYNDHKHIFGTDTTQTKRAVALCTYDKQTTSTEIYQGGGRLRELLQEQSLEFVLTEACKTALCGNEHDLTIDRLLANSKSNTTLENEECLYRSLKHQMHNEVRSSVMEKLRNVKTVHEAIRIFIACQPALVEHSPNSPWELFGGQFKEIDRQASLKQYQQVCIDLAHTITIFDNKEKNAIVSALRNYTKTIDECTFTTKVREFAIGNEAQMEVLKEVERKNEVKSEISSTHLTRLPIRQRALWPDEIDFYKDDWIKESSLFSISKKIMQLFNKIIYVPSKGLQQIGNTFDKIEKYVTKKNYIPLNLLFGLSFGLSTAILIGAIAITILAFPEYYLLAIFLSWTAHNIYNRIDHLDLRFFNIQKIVRLHPSKTIQQAAPLFISPKNGRLLTTTNFMAVNDIKLFTPFGAEQKNGYNVLVVQEDNKWTVLLGDQSTDVAAWKTKLPKLKQSAQSSQRKIFVYDLINNTVTMDGPKITRNEDLEHNETFQKLILQAKLVNGLVHYTEKQLEILVNLLDKKEQKENLRAFIQEIHTYFPEKRVEFGKSSLKLVLNTES